TPSDMDPAAPLPAPGRRDAGGDAAWAQARREALAATDAALAARFDAGADATRLVAERARAADEVATAAWSRCLGDARGLSLFAVGGYGRGELFPHSDIDLLVLADRDPDEAVGAALSRLFALLWDCGLPAKIGRAHV